MFSGSFFKGGISPEETGGCGGETLSLSLLLSLDRLPRREGRNEIQKIPLQTQTVRAQLLFYLFRHNNSVVCMQMGCITADGDGDALEY